MRYKLVIKKLHELADPEKVIFKQHKYNIVTPNSLGIYHKDLKLLAKEIGYHPELALELINSDIYEARLLGSKLLKPKNVTIEMATNWITFFNTWEICDSFCMGLFSKTSFAKDLIFKWSKNTKEFEKRAAFAILSSYCMADKKAGNDVFLSFLPVIIDASDDDRIYVKKAVNWALRSIGKRNQDLNREAIKTAQNILNIGSKPGIWIAKDAIKELTGEKVNILDYPREIYRNHI
ncbi:MAG: DNA alkylation repair protein [Salibacteraceae bacterium]